MSAVLLVSINNAPAALFAADIDDAGLRNLLNDFPTPRAEVLIFPHHGGLPGRANPEQFATELCNAVQPRIVVFSLGRGVHENPNLGIIRGVRRAVPQAHIACTQLSTQCAAATQHPGASHLLAAAPSRGESQNACCMGTLSVRVDAGTIVVAPQLADHADFVTRAAPTALCRSSTTV
jgi:competence protein ComEC